MNRSILIFIVIVLCVGCGSGRNFDDSLHKVVHVNTESGLVMRSRPATNSVKILTISDKSEIYVLEVSAVKEEIEGRTGPWLKIRYNNMEGWVFGGFVDLSGKAGRKRRYHVTGAGIYVFNVTPLLLHLGRERIFKAG